MIDCMNILPSYFYFERLLPVNKNTHQFYKTKKKNIAQTSLVVAQSLATRIAPFRSNFARRRKSGQALNRENIL